MADNTNDNGEKPSKFKQAFQYAAAFVGQIACEPPVRTFEQAGFTYDYAKAWIGSHRKPKFG